MSMASIEAVARAGADYVECGIDLDAMDDHADARPPTASPPPLSTV